MQRVIGEGGAKPDDKREDKRGGRRDGAGRPKTGKCHDAPHRRRPELLAKHPVHVVLRTYMTWLRTGDMYKAVHKVLKHFLGRADFRVCHLSIQKNHIHFLIEAANRKALSRGMSSLASRCAHAINAVPGGRGEVFTYRYHATQIVTARQARNCLAYVLNNWRKHRQDCVSEAAFQAKVDPYSSGFSFGGWAGVNGFKKPDYYDPLPVSDPETALLSHEWKRYGYIGLFEIPGPLR